MTARLTIDSAAAAANWQALAARHGAPTAAVVKADAYGLGAAHLAPRLHEAGARKFFVAHPAEGAALRALLPDATIYILNGLWSGEAGFYQRHGLIPVLGSLEEIADWRDHAAATGHTLPAVLHVDTGMNRLGLDAAELARLVVEGPGFSGIDLRYVMTHLANAEVAEDPENHLQVERLRAARHYVPGIQLSIANSSALFLGEDFRSDLARPGAALYGVNPTPGRPNPMRPVIRLEAQVLRLREIPAGQPVGYNAIWTARRPTRVATLSVGYADGFPRALSNRAVARFDGRPVPLIGRVSMDLTTFDVTDHPAIGPGSWIELIGPDNPPCELAVAASTNGYEILTSLGARYERSYGPL